MQMIKN